MLSACYGTWSRALLDAIGAEERKEEEIVAVDSPFSFDELASPCSGTGMDTRWAMPKNS